MEARRLLLVRLWQFNPHHFLTPVLPSPPPPMFRSHGGLLGSNVHGHGFASSASEQPSSSSSWLQRLKGLFLGQERVQTAADQGTAASHPGPVAASLDELSLEKFADELKKAQAFGKMTQFGRGLPRGGEAIAARSLQRQEEILRKLAIYSPDGQRLEAKHKSEVATQCGCTVKDVNDVLGKYEWAREANARMMRLKADGKPLPRSLDEVEKMMGSRWKAAASVNLSKDSQLSRNGPCPCGSGKKYKRYKSLEFRRIDCFREAELSRRRNTRRIRLWSRRPDIDDAVESLNLNDEGQPVIEAMSHPMPFGIFCCKNVPE